MNYSRGSLDGMIRPPSGNGREEGGSRLGRVSDGRGTDYEQIIFHLSWFRMRYLFR